jgi:hypothetical protein
MFGRQDRKTRTYRFGIVEEQADTAVGFENAAMNSSGKSSSSMRCQSKGVIRPR